jgi:hypothetical protein
MSDDTSSRIEALKAAAKARLLEKFERDWAEAERLATTYPELFQITAPVGTIGDLADSANPRLRFTVPQQIASAFDGTVKGLIEAYKSDPDSGYQKLRHSTRQNYNSLLRRIENDIGPDLVADLDARRLKAVHEAWTNAGKHIAMAHALMTTLRTLSSFGATWLKSNECRELKATLSGMEFKMPEQRTEQLTAEDATEIRKKAREMGFASIALAQAIQYDCRLKQKDVIGEWVPVSDSNMSDVIDGNEKWVLGLRWEELDEKFILRRGKDTIDLKLYPMVREELEQTTRKASGPIIVYERTLLPYQTYQFRRVWRQVADAAEISKNVRNMDSRAPARLDRLTPAYRHLRKQERESR